MSAWVESRHKVGAATPFQYRNSSVIAGLMALSLSDPTFLSPPMPATSHARVVRLSRLSAAAECPWSVRTLGTFAVFRTSGTGQ